MWLARQAPDWTKPSTTDSSSTLRLSGVIFVLMFLAAWPALPQPAANEEAAASEDSPLILSEVMIDPAQPGVSDLCDLKVSITNRGETDASRFRFSVAINGVPLETYDDRVFFERVPGQETVVIDLFRFWVNEKSRPVRPGQKLSVEVKVVASSWVSHQLDQDGVEVSTVVGKVAPLPTKAQKTISLRSGETP